MLKFPFPRYARAVYITSSMQLHLPIKWHRTSIKTKNSAKYIYGFWTDPKQCQCSLFLTNFETVWAYELDKQTLTQKAKDLGVDELSPSTLSELLQSMENNVVAECLSFTYNVALDVFIASMEIELHWAFELKKLNLQNTISFFTKLNFQHSNNSDFLMFQVKQLKTLIEAKDSYNRFLVMNFKQSHGDEQIKRYWFNHKEDVDAIKQYEDLEWETYISKAYRERKMNMDKSEEQLCNIAIDIVISPNWELANKLHLQLEDGKLIGKVNNDYTQKSISLIVNSQESLQRASQNSNGSPSPRKRKRIGQL